MTNSDVTIRVYENQTALAQAAAREFVATVCTLQNTKNMVNVVLTGGGAGVETLRQIAALDAAARQQAESFPIQAIDWNRVNVFFGDERYLPEGDPERNDTQAQEALLAHVDVPEFNIFRYAAPSPEDDYAGEGLDRAAESYAQLIQEHAPDGFDVHLLGMGPEGHINSLFPHTEELLQPKDCVVPVRDCPKPPANRVSLSIDAVNDADHVWLLVAGAAKREAAVQVAEGGNGAQWPAALATGRQSTVLWVDQEAQP
ncbi:6-phosphogluconolactonase [Corynebacterium sp. zg254]|uniref:6-phosphogluconolactonase n=1 Tax=Corynebacterium zhongnanshanii TaxID=2768834 RepID=A0ABQ6VGT8_9CORY|nr:MULTISPECIES: 6-phosphogluconolactonase [Corynebacterium]KAB3523475.1 6-phosphogluconolactonase [Corynebacterium zhongnanshanii]MCR5913383.1 6-phosphogluconolactonase [Corynebacterium sp. zg254]